MCIICFIIYKEDTHNILSLTHTQELIRAKLIESDLKLPKNLIDDPSIQTTNYLANIHDLDAFYRKNVSIQKSHISSKGQNYEGHSYEGEEDEGRFSVAYTAYDKDGDSFTGHNSEGVEEEEEYYDDTFESDDNNNNTNNNDYDKDGGNNSDPYDFKLDSDDTFIISTEISRQRSHTNLLNKPAPSPGFQLIKPPTNTKPNNGNNSNKNSKHMSPYTISSNSNTGLKSPHVIEKKGIRGDRVRGKQPPNSSAVVRFMTYISYM